MIRLAARWLENIQMLQLGLECNERINSKSKLIFIHFLFFRCDSSNSENQNDYENAYNTLNEVVLNRSKTELDDLFNQNSCDSEARHYHQQQEQEININAIDYLSSSASHQSSFTSSASCITSRNLRRSSCDDTDLEMLDRELNALDASMPLTDPEITQGVEQLERAVLRKRLRSEEEDNDRLVREALSQFYLPSPRLLSGIDDCPLFVAPDAKRSKTTSHTNTLNNNDLIDFQSANQNSMDFEVIMDALRLGSSPNSLSSNCATNNDSCGQAALMSENGVFHNLVVSSLET